MNNFGPQDYNQNNNYLNSNIFNNNNRSFEQSLSTNKWKVQNLQEALSRFAPPNSCGCYFCVVDNEEYEYEIYTDMNGQKSYKVFKRIPCENATSQDVDLKALIKKIDELEAKINANTKPTTNPTNGTK